MCFQPPYFIDEEIEPEMLSDLPKVTQLVKNDL